MSSTLSSSLFSVWHGGDPGTPREEAGAFWGFEEEGALWKISFSFDTAAGDMKREDRLSGEGPGGAEPATDIGFMKWSRLPSTREERKERCATWG